MYTEGRTDGDTAGVTDSRIWGETKMDGQTEGRPGTWTRRATRTGGRTVRASGRVWM